MKKHSIKHSKLLFLIIIAPILVGLATIALTTHAQTGDLNKPFGNVNDMGTLTNVIFQLGIAICVLTACIYIAFGSFYYFLASGDAKLAQKGKEVIQRALIGLVLALVSWVILNTIHPQFTKLEIETPEFSQK